MNMNDKSIKTLKIGILENGRIKNINVIEKDIIDFTYKKNGKKISLKGELVKIGIKNKKPYLVVLDYNYNSEDNVHFVPTSDIVKITNVVHSGEKYSFSPMYSPDESVLLLRQKDGVLESDFVAEVKSDLMGEQTILCGMLQAGTIVCYDKMVADGMDPKWVTKFLMHGWNVITEALKWGGITGMMDRLSNPAKIKANQLSKDIKALLAPLYQKHMDDIISGEFSSTMMKDWANKDANLLAWREETGKLPFETMEESSDEITEQEYFDKGIIMVAMVKAGCELAFETMVDAGIKEESAYYESLHEVPLIANLIDRKRLYEMNKVISDTAEYGCYLFARVAAPMMAKDLMPKVTTEVIGKGLNVKDNSVSNAELVEVNAEIRNHPIEVVGRKLRAYMTAMKPIIK